MSPQFSRNPSSSGAVTGDSAEPRGRHRRPESLADVATRPAPAARVPGQRSEPVYRRGKLVAGFVDDGTEALPQPRTARHSRDARPGRHAAARPPAQRRPRNHPPRTGTHRAPGTLPIESWLLMGKTRQQALLASLVAVGILLLALPAEQRRDGVDAVNTAAQAVAGVQTGRKAEPAPPPADRPAERASKPAERPEAPPQPTASAVVDPKPPSAAPTAAKPSAPAVGPGNSLRVTGTEAVALTFDDGPDPVQTPRILELLDKYDVKAVFCLVGVQVKRHPDLVRQIVEAGHTLCNHTWDHSLTIGKDKPGRIRADLARTNAAIQQAAPGAPIPFFRAPGGNFTDVLVDVAGRDGMTSLYWEVDPRDWEHPEGETTEQHVDRIVKQVRAEVRPGAIVLSHDFGQPATITAYEELLPWLTENFTIGMPKQVVPEAPDTDEPDPAGTPSPDASASPTSR